MRQTIFLIGNKLEHGAAVLVRTVGISTSLGGTRVVLALMSMFFLVMGMVAVGITAFLESRNRSSRSTVLNRAVLIATPLDGAVFMLVLDVIMIVVAVGIITFLGNRDSTTVLVLAVLVAASVSSEIRSNTVLVRTVLVATFLGGFVFVFMLVLMMSVVAVGSPTQNGSAPGEKDIPTLPLVQYLSSM